MMQWEAPLMEAHAARLCAAGGTVMNIGFGAAACAKRAPPLGGGQCPSSAPAPPQGAPGGSGRRGTPRGRRGPATGRPATLPRVLERAASKAAAEFPLTVQAWAW